MNLDDLKHEVYQTVFTEGESKILNNLDFQNMSKVIYYLVGRGVIQAWQPIDKFVD